MSPHIHELIDFTACVYIVYKNKVLIRHHDKYDYWLPPGGHIELNETPDKAVIREAKEEVGLNIKLFDKNKPLYKNTDRITKLVAPYFLDIHKISDTHKHIGMIYYALSDTDKVVPTKEDDKSNDWKWMTSEELETFDLLEDVRFYAKKALELLAKAS